MNEGSQEVDTGNLPVVSNDESAEAEEIKTRDEGTEGQEETQDTEGEGAGEGEKPKLTEKGTKLDPNPLSAAHQQLANERKLRAQYEQVLSSPELLRKFAKEMGMSVEEAKAEIKEEQKNLYTPERFKTAQDIADVLNEMQTSFAKTVAELKEENRRLRGDLSGISSSRQAERVVTTMQSDIADIRSKYPQLNPKSPEYDPALEEEIGSFYLELDGVDPNDPSKGVYGKYSLAKITDRFMKVRGVGAKEGSNRAQTNVITRQAGRVVTTSKAKASDTPSSPDAGTSIAQKIAKTLKTQS